MTSREKAKRGTCREHIGRDGGHMAGSVACVEMSVRDAVAEERARIVLHLKARAAEHYREDPGGGAYWLDAAQFVEGLAPLPGESS